MTTDDATDCKPERCTDCMVGQGREYHCRETMSDADMWILVASFGFDLAVLIGIAIFVWRAWA